MKLVFLHALPFGGAMWDDIADQLGHDWIAPDLPADGTLRSWAETALDACGDEPLVVIGESVGGSAAVEIARARPDQVECLVIIGTKAGVNRDEAARDRAIDLLLEDGLAEAWRVVWEPLLGPGASETQRATACAAALERDVARVVDGVRAFHDRRDDADFLRTWAKPLVGISGEHDRTPSPTLVRALASGADRSFHMVADCGHYVHLEQPDRLVELLADAIDQAAERLV